MTTLLLKKVQGNKRALDISKVLDMTTLLLKKLQGSKRTVDILNGIA